MNTTEAQTIVIKLGTSVLTQGTTRLDRSHLVEIVRQCALARAQGHRIIIVTSGAIAAGKEHLNHPQLPATIATKQLFAAVGQIELIQLWENLFSLYNLHIGQMLLTRADLEDRERFLNARDTLCALLDYGVVPVINENDAVVTAEIKVGDNDNLSALAAMLANATTLVLLTDQEGLYTKDPRTNPDAELISEVAKIDGSIYALAGGSVSGLGTGGMTTKIQAAEIATRAGIRVVIAAGNTPENISKICADEVVGTLFLPHDSPLEARKRWLFGPPPAGSLVVDTGAAEALVHKGSSLLPKGILRISGSFTRGSVVRILTEAEQEIARGVVNYSSDDLQRIQGQHSDAIAQILGYAYGAVAVHRDDCIVQTR